MKKKKSPVPTLISVMAERLIAWVIPLIPKVSREHLLSQGRKSGYLTVVEQEYVCEIPLPNDALARQRFSHLTGKHIVPPFFGIILQDVRLIGPYGIPVTRSGRLVVEPILASWLPHVLKVTIRELGLTRLAFEYFLAVFPIFQRAAEKIDFAAHLICRGADWQPGRGAIYGHWFGEQIPQLRAIEKIQEKTERRIKLIINRDAASWQLESLEMLGYGSSDLIEHLTPGARVQNLVISSLRNVHSQGMELDPRARRWASERLVTSLQGRRSKGPERIAFLRTEQIRRTTANITDVREELANANFVEDEDAPGNLADIARNTRKIKHIVSISGSSVFRMLFCKQPESLLEIFPLNFYQGEFCFLLSFELGATYQCVPALEVPLIENSPIVWQGSRIPHSVRDALFIPGRELAAKLRLLG